VNLVSQLPVSFHPPLFPEQNLWRYVSGTSIFTGRMSFLSPISTVSKHWSFKAVSLTMENSPTGLVFSSSITGPMREGGALLPLRRLCDSGRTRWQKLSDSFWKRLSCRSLEAWLTDVDFVYCDTVCVCVCARALITLKSDDADHELRQFYWRAHCLSRASHSRTVCLRRWRDIGTYESLLSVSVFQLHYQRFYLI